MSSKHRALYAYFVLTILYIAEELFTPAPKQTLQRYHITSLHLRVLDLSFALLFAVIWFCAVYGFYNFRQYYRLIQKTKDGKPLASITTGIGFLAFWIPVTSVIGTYTTYIGTQHASLMAPITVTQNYLSLVIPLLGFIFISVGARGLIDIVKQRPSLRGTNILVILVIAIGVTYIYLVSNTHNRLNSTYHLPTFFILATLATPYIYMWFIGLLSLYEIFLYRLRTPGIVYRDSWRLLGYGLGALIVISIVLQYLTTISERLTRLDLNWALIVIYLLLVLLAIAYILIALGVRNLKKIEEV